MAMTRERSSYTWDTRTSSTRLDTQSWPVGDSKTSGKTEWEPIVTGTLEELLPTLLPGAIAWVKEQSAHILESGSPLSEEGIRLATAVGVSNANKIRICMVPKLPLPEDPMLQQVALQTGLLGDNMIGITFGYGIYLCDGYVSNSLVSHECRHVYQYEAASSIDAFLPIYLHQIATVGYDNAPYEIDARAHEID